MPASSRRSRHPVSPVSDRSASLRRVVLLAVLPLALAGCAPDAWRPDRPFDDFLGQIDARCGQMRLGAQRITDLIANETGDDGYFIDLSSRFFHAKISQASYVSALEGGYMARSGSPAIACILEPLPGDAPPPK